MPFLLILAALARRDSLTSLAFWDLEAAVFVVSCFILLKEIWQSIVLAMGRLFLCCCRFLLTFFLPRLCFYKLATLSDEKKLLTQVSFFEEYEYTDE